MAPATAVLDARGLTRSFNGNVRFLGPEPRAQGRSAPAVAGMSS